MTWLVVVAAALAVVLLLPPVPRLETPAPTRPGLIVLPALAVGALVLPRYGGLVLVLTGAGVGAVGLWRRRRRRRRAAEVASRVLETCELLAGELAAGLPPDVALGRAADAWDPIAPVAEAFRVGADVPEALRSLAARVEGAGDLRVVAAAWQVAHRTGQGLGSVVEQVAGSLRAASATRRLVEGELASARATARLVAGLPVLALVMGSGAGGDPWGFLLTTPAGLVCLGAGLACGLAGLWWIEAIAAEVEAT